VRNSGRLAWPGGVHETRPNGETDCESCRRAGDRFLVNGCRQQFHVSTLRVPFGP